MFAEVPGTAQGMLGTPWFKGVDYCYLIDNPKMPLDEAYEMPPHHGLHMWLHRENFSGVDVVQL